MSKRQRRWTEYRPGVAMCPTSSTAGNRTRRGRIRGFVLIMKMITNPSKLIVEENRVAAKIYTYAVKSPLVTMARPKFTAKSTPSRGPIPKPHYLFHAWIHATYDAKRHPDLIRLFSTMHWTHRRTHRQTDAPTDRQIVHGKVWSL